MTHHLTTKQLLFENKTCTRCGGGGEYSFCQMYGTTCFQCAGWGRVLTKRGIVANAFYQDSLTKPFGEVVVGDVVLVPGIPGFCASKWGTVTAVSADTLTTTAGDLGKTERIRYKHTREAKAAKIAAALAYQATLTKTGTVRKGPAPPEKTPEEKAAAEAKAREKAAARREKAAAKRVAARVADAEANASRVAALRADFETKRAALVTRPHPAIPSLTLADYVTWLLDHGVTAKAATVLETA